jgi:glycosyltransferase involved in cell wall biosynthesis
MLTVAAIVPVYNRPKAAIEALESIAAQTYRANRVIVVDDGSKDDTADVVQRWIDAHRPGLNATLIRQPNGGASAARNRGAAEAGNVDLLAFLDSDDLWPADYLARMTAAFAADASAVAASCDRTDYDLAENRRYPRSHAGIDHSTTAYLIREGSAGTPNTVFRTSAFRAVGGYDTTQHCGEDYQLMLRLSLRGKWLYVPGEAVTVRRGLSGTQEAALSRRFDDRRYRLAQVMDRFITAEGGAQAAPAAVWKRTLGRLWYSAGRQLIQADRRAEARHCFRRAAQILPLHLRARLRALIT